MCLIARPSRVLEHQITVARQAREAGLTVCWLDLGFEPGAAETVLALTGERAHTMRSSSEFRRHLAKHRPSAVWLLTPFPDHYPDWLFSLADGRLVYSGYGPNQSTWTRGLYQLETYDRCRYILADSDVSRRGYIENGQDPEKVLLVGTPMMYEVRRAEARVPLDHVREIDVLWAPHWTEDWFGQTGYSSWRRNSHVFLDFATRHPDARIAIRPHPLLEPTLREASVDDPDAIAYRELVALPNVEVSEMSMVEDILRAEALVTDGVSIIAYFAATGRPMGVTRYAGSPDSNEVGRALVAASDLLADEAALQEWLGLLAEHHSSPARKALSEALHPTFERSPVDLWVEHAMSDRRRRSRSGPTTGSVGPFRRR